MSFNQQQNGKCFKTTEKSANRVQLFETAPASPQAAAFEGYFTFQLKPACEPVIVCQKPMTEQTYVAQALAWYEQNEAVKRGEIERTSIASGAVNFDECHMPLGDFKQDPHYRKNAALHKRTVFNGIHPHMENMKKNIINGNGNYLNVKDAGLHSSKGRFPANVLLETVNILDDGKTYNASNNISERKTYSMTNKKSTKPIFYQNKGDSGSQGRYYDLSAWNDQYIQAGIKQLPAQQQKTYPVLQIGKPRTEKHKGLHGKINHHVTVKPVALMRYLITLFSRKNDTILDPFSGSGTTGVACIESSRKYVGIEKSQEYHDIAAARVSVARPLMKQKSMFTESNTDIAVEPEVAPRQKELFNDN